MLLGENSIFELEEKHQVAVLENIPDPSIAGPSSTHRIEMSNPPIKDEPPRPPSILSEPVNSCNESLRSSPVASLYPRFYDVTPNGSPRSSCFSISTNASDSMHKTAFKRYKYQKNEEIAALRLKLREVTRAKELYRKRYERLKRSTFQSENKTKEDEDEEEKPKPDDFLRIISAAKKV